MAMGVREAQIRGDFASYSAPDGSLTGVFSPKDAAGNGLLFSAERLIAYRQQEVVNGNDLADFARLVKAREIEPGLYLRTPKGTPFSDDQQKADDYYGMAAVSYLLAMELFENGKRRKFRWAPFGRFGIYFFTIPLPYYYPTRGQDDHDPGAWFGYLVGFVSHLRICAGKAWPWHRWIWAFSVAFGSKDDDQDSWLINWVMIYANKDPGWLERKAIERYQSRLKERWNGRIGDVFARYFGVAGAPNYSHPLAKWTR